MSNSRPILFSPMMVEAILAGRKTMTRRVLKAGFDANSMELEKIIRPPAQYNLGGPSNLNLGTQAYFNDLNHNNPKSHLLGCKCPFGNVGELLWIRESYYEYGYWTSKLNGAKFTFVRVPGEEYKYFDNRPNAVLKGRTDQLGWYKRPSLFMPREASRITLEITNIRVGRLNDISEDDAKAEGIETKPYGDPPYFCTIDYEFAEKYRKRGSDFKPGYCADTGYQFRDSFKSLWKLINGKDSWDLNPWVWVVEFKRKEVGDA